MSCKIAKSGI